MNILQVNYYDNLGGAARIAWLLHQGYRKQGLNSWMAVGRKFSDDPFVRKIKSPDADYPFLTPFLSLAEIADQKNWKLGSKNLSGLFRRIATPSHYQYRNKGFEDFNFPGSRLITSLPDKKPDLIHLHNLHLNYFDLSYLPELSQEIPVVLTLHDMWTFTGHCAYSMDCPRWKTGCGECPYLNSYPAIRHDQTAYNWQRKKKIYEQSRFYLTGPSNWIVESARESILAPAIIQSRVIPNGIDLSIFKPFDIYNARTMLDLPLDAFILLFISASGIKHSSFKDYATIENAIELVSQKVKNKKILLIALGDNDSQYKVGEVEFRFISHVSSVEKMAQFYQAADLFVHAANADNFPSVVLEAQACGTPVIATSVGGIRDTIIDGETGFLTRPKDPQGMAERIIQLMNDTELKKEMAAKASVFAHNNFGLDKMIQRYLSLYKEILPDRIK